MEVYEICFVKHEAHACYRPEVFCVAKANGLVVPFQAVVDTGADITCVPKYALKRLGRLNCLRDLRVVDCNGNIKRVPTYDVLVEVLGKEFVLRRGVVSTIGDEGLLGRDVLDGFNFEYRGAEQKVVFRL